jgi:4'-phosphopantetheinyl transferase
MNKPDIRLGGEVVWKDLPELDFKSCFQLWKIEADRDFGFFEKWKSFLNKEDLDKINRFINSSDRKTSLISHLIRRVLASVYLGISIKELTFFQNEYGKPLLPSFSHFNFNISHTRDFALILLGPWACGVDVEAQRHISLEPQFLNEVLHPEELDYLSKCNTQEEIFYKIWVLKKLISKELVQVSQNI